MQLPPIPWFLRVHRQHSHEPENRGGHTYRRKMTHTHTRWVLLEEQKGRVLTTIDEAPTKGCNNKQQQHTLPSPADAT